MNTCAVRILRTYSVGLYSPPHEPVMNASQERWGVSQKEDRLIAVDPHHSFNAIYVCKHCGLLYMEDGDA